MKIVEGRGERDKTRLPETRDQRGRTSRTIRRIELRLTHAFILVLFLFFRVPLQLLLSWTKAPHMATSPTTTELQTNICY